jgi:PilZ domain
MAFMSKPGSGPESDDRRQYPRSSAQGRAKLLPGALTGARSPAFDVEIVDRSMTGLRIKLQQEGAVTGEVILLAASTGHAYEARVVWKSYPHVGLQVRRSIDMRSAGGPETATLRRLWRETFGA